MNLEQLRARLKQINIDMTAIVDDADANNSGELTAEQQAQFDSLKAEFGKVKGQVDRKESLQDQSGDLSQSTGRTTTAAEPLAPAASARYELEEQVDPQSGFSDMAEFGQTVMQACMPGSDIDDRLRVMGAPTGFQREGGGTEGFEVPPQYRNEIWKMVFEEDTGLLSMVDSEPTASNQVAMLKDETTPWGSTGIISRWAAEGAKMEPSKLEDAEFMLKLHKLYAFVLATEELLEDAPRLHSRLMNGASEAIRWKIVESIFEGTGVGQPKGFMNSKAKIAVAKEAGQTAKTIVASNVIKMFSRLLSAGASRAVWYANSDILEQLAVMTVGDKLIWTPPSSGFQNAPGGFLFGRPIQFTEQAQTVGTEGDLSLVDPKGYYLPQKAGGVKFDSSIHLYFDYDIQAFKWTFRVGGHPFLSKPVSPKHGTNTKSHFVTLATRA